MVHKIAITVDENSLPDIDRLVQEGRYPNRSKAFQSALGLLLERDTRARLNRELNKLDPVAERQLAEEGLGEPFLDKNLRDLHSNPVIGWAR